MDQITFKLDEEDSKYLKQLPVGTEVSLLLIDKKTYIIDKKSNTQGYVIVKKSESDFYLMRKDPVIRLKLDNRLVWDGNRVVLKF